MRSPKNRAHILIAARIYDDFDIKTLVRFELRDRMYRKPCGSFCADGRR